MKLFTKLDLKICDHWSFANQEIPVLKIRQLINSMLRTKEID